MPHDDPGEQCQRVPDACLISRLEPRAAAWPRELVQQEMQMGSISRRRAKKRLSARLRRSLRFATSALPQGGVQLVLLTPGCSRSIALTPAECGSLGELLSRAARSGS